MTRLSRWWSGRAGVDRVDLATRWQLYLLSASEPLLAFLLIGGQPRIRGWGVGLLLVVTAAHTAACVALLRAGIASVLGERRPTMKLVGLAGVLTVAGIAAGVLAFPVGLRPAEGGFRLGFPAGAAALMFCAALTGALTPLLRMRRLLDVVGVPAVAAGVLQVATGNAGRALWAVNYLLASGAAAVIYRSGVWFLGVVWELERGREAQARLAVAEERLRFARDLHDVLGRNLALIAVNSELAAELARRGQDGAAERMVEVHRTAQESIREMRAVVSGYRAADLDAELAGARSVLRSAGIRARVIGEGTGLPRSVQTAFGWVVREATTNILRHSQSTAVTIELDVVPENGTAPATAVLRIGNDGVHTRDAGSPTGAGTGLVGLRERLAGLGGQLDAEARGDRFEVRARLPLPRPLGQPLGQASPSASKPVEPVP